MGFRCDFVSIAKVWSAVAFPVKQIPCGDDNQKGNSL